MNHETLERLLIDRKLGELSADVLELLAAYLRQNPRYVADEASLEAAIDIAQETLRHEQSQFDHPLPPPSPRLLAKQHRDRSRPKAPSRYPAIAAAILLAFFLGERRAAQTPSHDPGTGAYVTSEGGPALRTRSGFWSLERLQAQRTFRSTARGRRIQWTTPLNPSEIGDAS